MCASAAAGNRINPAGQNPEPRHDIPQPISPFARRCAAHGRVSVARARHSDERVLEAMTRVPRHEFAPEVYRNQAYEDHPLPIGEGQTISQPYIVALMLEALALVALRPSAGGRNRIGLRDRVARRTGGGGFLDRASSSHWPMRHEILLACGYTNVRVIVGDGSQGFAAAAPYDAIIVSAAAAKFQPALVRTTGRRRTNDYSGGPRRFAAIAVDSTCETGSRE